MRRYELNCRYNEKARKIVGRSLLAENKPPPPEKQPKVTIPGYRQIGEVFGGRYVFDGTTTWLKGNMNDADDLAKKLKEVRALTSDPEAFRKFVLPADWDERCKAVYELYGQRPDCFRGVRGPVTLATSVFGTENLLFLYYDDEPLFTEFADAIGDVLLAYIDLMARESGRDPDNLHHGFSFSDDDSNLMTPDMYKAFGYRRRLHQQRLSAHQHAGGHGRHSKFRQILKGTSKIDRPYTQGELVEGSPWLIRRD